MKFYCDPKSYKLIQVIGSTIEARSKMERWSESFFKKFHKPLLEETQQAVQKLSVYRQETLIIRLKYSSNLEQEPIIFPATQGTKLNQCWTLKYNPMLHKGVKLVMTPLYFISTLFKESINKDIIRVIFEEEENCQSSNTSSSWS